MIAVVAALIECEGKLLIAGQEKKFYGGFRWEFPGGKLEDFESPEQALKREILEELGIEVCVGRVYDVVRHVYDGGRDVLLLFYWAAIVQGEPRPLDGQQLRWVAPGALRDYPFAEADRPVVDRLSD